jgi:hypothetical protein
MNWLGLDVGGAHLKAADGRGWTRIAPFALWKNPAGLAAALAALLETAPPAQRIAVTMTGELCDCFRTKAEGVRHILASVASAAGERTASVYLVDGRLVSLEEAREFPRLAAASNWHALARFACRFLDRRTGVLIDIGSTTTDVIPLVDGQPRPQGWNDTERLAAGALVYTGVGRTPLCAITDWLPWRGQPCPVAAELFATAADAYVLLDCIAEQPDAICTADGRPLTKRDAHSRLARMICADASDFDEQNARQAAEFVRDAQLAAIGRALRQVIERFALPPQCLVLSGSGEFLARRLAETAAPRCDVVSLSERLGAAVCVSATAHALAVLAAEATGGPR